MYNRNITIEQTDPELWAAIQAENARQEHHIELIASENYASPAVMQALLRWLRKRGRGRAIGH
jgi:glycine hydroxymethyltransferase